MDTEKTVKYFEIGMFGFGVINVLWASVKATALDWKIFFMSLETLHIFGALFGGVYLLYIAVEDYWSHTKYGYTVHNIDETKMEAILQSLKNGGLAMLIIVYAGFLGYGMIHPFQSKIFSLNSLNLVLLPGLTVIAHSLYRQIKSKE